MHMYIQFEKYARSVAFFRRELSRNKARTRLPTLVDSQIVSTETFADGRNSDAYAERETHAAPFLSCRLRYSA